MPDGQHVLCETELLRQLREGNGNSFKELYDLYKNRIFSTAMRMLGNRQDAEDAAQEVFVLIFRNIKNCREDAAFPAWVYRIAMNTCINHLKKRKRFKSEELSDSSPAEPLNESTGNSPAALQSFIEQEITRLPEKSRTVFILHEIEGFKHEEIAGIMGISPGTSKSQLFFAKSSLRKKLKPFVEVLKNELP